MSHNPPIYPQTRLSFPEHVSWPPHAPQPHPQPSNFFSQPPNNYTGVDTSFNSVSPAAIARARLLQLFATSMGRVQSANQTTGATQLMQTLRPDQVEQLLRYLQANANGLTEPPYFSSAAATAPYHQLPANPASNLLGTATSIQAPYPAGQAPTSTAPPTAPSSTDGASAPKVPSDKALGKRRARSNSAVEGENEGPSKQMNDRKIAKSKATKVLSCMAQPPVLSSTVAGSGATLSPLENIPPPAGAKFATSNSAPASNEEPPAKRPRKQRKSNSSTQEAGAPASGIRAMQTVFRASATSPPPSNSMPVHAKYPPPIENLMQPHPSHVPQGAVPQVNGQNTTTQIQINDTLSLPRPQLQSQIGSSSHMQPRKRLPPLAMDSQAMYRIRSAVRAVEETGDLRALYPLMGYSFVQELLKHLLLTAIRKKWVARRRDRNMALDFEPSVAQNGDELSSQVSNVAGLTPQAGFREGPNNDMANVRISQNPRLVVDRSNVGQNQMQMIPQNVGGTYDAEIPSADRANDGYATTYQPAVDTYQMSQNAETDFFAAFGNNGLSMAVPAFQGGGVQPEVEAHQLLANAHNIGCQDSSAPAGAHPSSAAYNPYDLCGVTWDDAISQMASSEARVETLSQTQGSIDSVGRVGVEASFEEYEYTASTQATVDLDHDPNLPGSSKKDSPAPEEADPFDIIRNEASSSGESAGDDSGLNGIVQTTDTHDEGPGLESFIPTHKDPQSINQALYGNPENSLDTLSFHMPFGSDAEFLQTLFPEKEREEGSSFVTPPPETLSTFQMEDFFNFDLN